MTGFLALAVLLLPANATDLPPWKRVVLRGKPQPAATTDRLLLWPAGAAACVLKDETKPLDTQDSPHDCGEIAATVYLSVGRMLFPPVQATGTAAGGLSVSWESWKESMDGWGREADKLDVDSAGIVRAVLYSAPLDGGCTPSGVEVAPVHDPRGQACLVSHGRVELFLGPGALASMSTSPADVDVADLRRFAPCSLCEQGFCEAEACRAAHRRVADAMQPRLLELERQRAEEEAERRMQERQETARTAQLDQRECNDCYKKQYFELRSSGLGVSQAEEGALGNCHSWCGRRGLSPSE